MNVAAALFVSFVGAINSDDGRYSNLFSFVVKCILIDGEGLIEAMMVYGGQLQHVVVVREGVNAHFHVIRLLIAIFLHAKYYKIYDMPL